MAKTQSFESHAQYVPAYHFFLLSVLFVNMLGCLWMAFKNPNIHTVFMIFLAAAAVVMSWYLRIWPLRVQDRLIRLEERLRMQELLPEDLKARIPELREGQLVGLRFASDEELPDLVRQVLEEPVYSQKEIKKRIKTWRPDHFRV